MTVFRPLLQAAATCTALCATTVHADIVNGQFNVGLTGWQTMGDASSQSMVNAFGLPVTASNALVLSTASLYDDDVAGHDGLYNLSGQSAVDVNTDLAAFAHTTPESLELDPVDHTLTGIEGSAASQTVNVHAGDTLSFNWNLISRDRDMPDTAWLLMSPQAGDGHVFTLAHADQAMSSVNGDAALQQTNWQSFSHTFDQTGAVTLTWAVADMNDWGQTSFLAVQHVQLTSAVPEPTSAALMLVALGAVGFRSRKGSKNVEFGT